ncbi:MAG: zinc ABC transporter substrate-binding protein [Bacteroidales bacterium]
MTRLLFILAIVTFLSCNRNSPETGGKIITISIAPYSYFVSEIGGNDFRVNIMVPPGSNPHIYEPYPEQISHLRKSVAYISNGYLGFEMTWLDRFYEINKTMRRLSLGDKIDPIASSEKREGRHSEGADPHYWVSPSCALVMASEVRDLLSQLNPAEMQKYHSNCDSLIMKIKATDAKARSLFAGFSGKSFMIYHPNLAYLARDYGLKEIAVEFEGKEPPPSRLKELIDIAAADDIKTIFVQKEYDSKNAREIAREIGGHIVIIDPLSENWEKSTNDIIKALYDSFTVRNK